MIFSSMVLHWCAAPPYGASTMTSSEILDCRDPDDGDILDGGAVARIDPHAVDLDRARGRHEVAMTSFAKRVFDGLAGLQRGAQHAGASANGQCVIVVVEAARERHEAPGTVGLGERLRPPGG